MIRLVSACVTDPIISHPFSPNANLISCADLILIRDFANESQGCRLTRFRSFDVQIGCCILPMWHDLSTSVPSHANSKFHSSGQLLQHQTLTNYSRLVSLQIGLFLQENNVGPSILNQNSEIHLFVDLKTIRSLLETSINRAEFELCHSSLSLVDKHFPCGIKRSVPYEVHRILAFHKLKLMLRMAVMCLRWSVAKFGMFLVVFAVAIKPLHEIDRNVKMTVAQCECPSDTSFLQLNFKSLSVAKTRATTTFFHADKISQIVLRFVQIGNSVLSETQKSPSTTCQIGSINQADLYRCADIYQRTRFMIQTAPCCDREIF